MKEKTNIRPVGERLKETSFRRPWQLMVIGNSEEPIELSGEAVGALTQIFDLCPHLPEVTLLTTKGELHVTREYSSGVTRYIDELIATVFRNEPQILGINFPDQIATPDNPYYSRHGKVFATVEPNLET